MSSNKNSSRSSTGSSGGNISNTDLRVAQAHQDQYDWTELDVGVNSASSSGTPVTRGLPSSTRKQNTRMSQTQPRSSFSTPVKKKSSSSEAILTPDTVTNTPSPSSSPDRHNGLSPMFERSGGTPRSSPKASPRNSHARYLDSLNDVGFIVVDMDEDEAFARRLDQELRDAELAAELERTEQSQNLARHQQASSAFAIEGRDSFNSNGPVTPNNPSSQDRQQEGEVSAFTSRRNKYMPYFKALVVFVLVTGVSFVTFLLLFAGPKAVVDPNTWMPGWPEHDSGKVGEHNKWVPDLVDNGLNLVVLNNLDRGSAWNEIFRQSISEWDNGTPDAVTLQMKRVSTYDPDCTAVKRAMKVCNGNYGPTDWRGVNQIILQDNFIITSIAKMNDYYLEGTDSAQMLYTMCHELGHGLGLGHFDENFYNKDLGNCMDYTERPENNMHPDESTYKALVELYGSVDGSASSTSVTAEKQLKIPGNRKLTLADEQFDKLAKYLLNPVEASAESGAGWRVLLRTENAVYHQKDLHDGYSIRSTILLA